MILRERLEKAAEITEKKIRMDLTYNEIKHLLDLLDLEDEPQEMRDYEIVYCKGFSQGYQRAIVDVIKRLKGMEWYGGDYKKECAAGVPEHHEGRAADLQREV